MHRTINHLLGCGLLAAALAGAAHLRAAEPAEAATTQTPGVSADRAAKDDAAGVKKTVRANRYPIRGRLKAVDTSAHTLTLSGNGQNRVFVTDAGTVFTRNGKTATLADGLPGEMVGGLAEKQPDGTVLAIKVRFGPKPPDSNPKPATSRKQNSRSKADSAMKP